MNDIFFISDTHFYHDNMLKFTNEDGDLVRPMFESIEHMNEVIVNKWNSVVTPQDKVYHLGDVAMKFGRNLDDLLKRLNGKKRLVLGNHDDAKQTTLIKHFQKVYLWRIFKEYDFVCTHLPIMPDQMRKVRFNVHGHIHDQNEPSRNHINVSVEKIGYTPVHLDKIRNMIAKRVYAIEGVQ